MLKIAEYSSAAKALKEKTLRALDEAGIEYELPQRQSDKIKLVFAGQYSAGKSTIIKMLTGNESIATGAEITTQEAHSYEWNGLEITDTPGVHTTLRPDHDEISYEAIASADMLVFVVTNELFDSYIADHFRKLAIDKDKAGEMILVVNKMDRAAKGNTPEQQEIIREGLKEVLAPYTPEQLHLSFLDAQSYLDSLEERESDPELADELLARSGYNEFVETLNAFVSEKSLSVKLTTELYMLDNILDKAIIDLQPKSSDSDIDALEENLIQQRHLLMDTRKRIGQEISDIYANGSASIRDLGLDAATIYGSSFDQEDFEERFNRYEKQVEGIMGMCQQEADDTVRTRLAELGENLDDIDNTEFTQNLKVRLVDKYDSLPDNVKKVFVAATNIETTKEIVIDSLIKSGLTAAFGDSADTVLKALSTTGASKRIISESIEEGSEAALKAATRTGKAATVAGEAGKAAKVAGGVQKGVKIGSGAMQVTGAMVEMLFLVKDGYDEKFQREAAQNNRRIIRSSFNSSAESLEDYSKKYIQEKVNKPIEKSLASIEGNIREIRDGKSGRSEQCVKFEKLQSEIGDMIVRLHSID